MLFPLSPQQALRTIVCARDAYALVLTLLLITSGAGVAARTPASTAPGVKDVVEFTRIIQPRHHGDEALASQVSPDGSRAFIVTRKADVRTDRNRYEVILLDVRADRLEAGRPQPPITVLTVDSLQDVNYADPSVQEVRWANDRTLLMRARVKDTPAQVYKLDVVTRRLTQLTFDPAGVVSYAITKDLGRIVYAVQVPNPPLAPGHRSLVVGNRSFWSVKHGSTDQRAQQRKFQYLAVRSGTRGPVRKLGEPFDESGGAFPGVSVSPDGRWALLHRHDAARQAEWIRRYPLVAEAAAVLGPAATNDPRSYYSRPLAYLARHLVAYRLADGQAYVALDAPDDAVTGGAQLRADRVWMGRGESVLIGGTHLPQATSRLGRPTTGNGSYVVQYWPDSGRWEIVTPLRGRLGVLRSEEGGRILVRDDGGDRRFVRIADGSWKQVEDVAVASRSGSTGPRWTLAVNEALDVPPDIEARGPQGQKVRLTRLNPQYDAVSWGAMRTHGWRDAVGRQWDGGLMVPADFDSARRYPLVIQSYGFSASRFYLDGANQSDGVTSGFAGRAYMREGILVLALPWRPSTGEPGDEHEVLATFAEGVRSGIESLVRAGIVDRERVGILGWSATGERVLNTVAFSDAPIRAATLLDGDANTLFSMTITYGFNDASLARKERTNRGGPFGESRERWTRNDPSLHTDCIRAALRIETYGPWVLNNWDLYALMRRQYKPVEMIAIPEGTHALSQPSERMISLQGNVDWYRFWLKGEERSEVFWQGESRASLRQQYVRWREMEELRQLDAARPTCSRRTETAAEPAMGQPR